VEHAWDLRPSAVIASATATVPAGYKGYVSFPLRARTRPGGLYFAFIDAQPEIGWAMFSDADGHASQVPVGATAADLPPGGLWRPFTRGRSLAMRVTPEQRPYAAQNVVRGTNRPDRWTNVFLSDAAQPLPAWIELKFPSPVRFNQVQITFDTDTNRRISLPLFHYPECVKSYEIAVAQGGGWKTVAAEDNNYFRRRVHRFEAVTASRLRINVLETNGAAEARIFEVRVYNEKSDA
jgi:hypothetical protein